MIKIVDLPTYVRASYHVRLHRRCHLNDIVDAGIRDYRCHYQKVPFVFHVILNKLKIC